jgi:hypothetical protein
MCSIGQGTPGRAVIAAIVRARARREWSLNGPIGVVIAVLVIYEIWIGSQIPTSGHGISFAEIGDQFLHNSHASPIISSIAVPNPQQGGYDGQFVYFIALDPLRARYYIDVPAYRYQRILYPMLAHILALGRADLTAYALLLINICALAGGTLAIAVWLRRRGQSPWYALLFGLSPGMAMGLELDLTEPLAFALLALAIYLLDFGGRWRVPLAALTFALALLARETSVVFALAYGATLLPHPGRGWLRRLLHEGYGARAALFGAIALTPFLAYKYFLLRWLGDGGMPPVLTPTPFPFLHLLSHIPWTPLQFEQIRAVIVPGLLMGGIAAWSLLRGGARDAAIWLMLVNALLYIVLLNAYSYFSLADTGRIAMGVMLAALYALPTLDRQLRGNHLWLWVSGALWLSATPGLVLLPVVRALVHAASQAI